MLQSLHIENFALIEDIYLSFTDGVTVFTGETGAGKSILIDALGAILGQRISADAIRSGCDALRVEAVFSCEESDAELRALLAEQEISAKKIQARLGHASAAFTMDRYIHHTDEMQDGITDKIDHIGERYGR